MEEKLLPICFVLMPFGEKPDMNGTRINFDQVYEEVIAPGIKSSGMQPLRADEEISSGIIHKEMFERLILSDVAVVDISSLNANVYYELGIRHALRKQSTVIIGAGDFTPPFDIAPLRISRYTLSAGGIKNAEEDASKLSLVISQAIRDKVVDSPVFQLIDLPVPDISRLRTDTFRDKSNYDASIKEQFARARKSGRSAVLDIVENLGEPRKLSVALASEALLSLRAVSAWDEMVDLADSVASEIGLSPMFIEQKGLALARSGRYEEGAALLERFILDHGGSSERYGILGGVYKRQWRAEKDGLLSDLYLKKAMNAYLNGFFLDWRDAYPGVNYLRLSFLSGQNKETYQEILPLVLFSVKRRLEADPDFWDRAAMSEIAALEGYSDAPDNPALLMRESWEGESLIESLRSIKKMRKEKKMKKLPWLSAYIKTLKVRAHQLEEE